MEWKDRDFLSRTRVLARRRDRLRFDGADKEDASVASTFPAPNPLYRPVTVGLQN